MANQSGKTKKSARGRLRIVAGIWRNRVLEIADVPGLRPTSERIRETLFNWLAPKIAGARCLDLYAGTGALGLEALSRGAASAEFIEKSAVACKALRRNLASLEAAGAALHVNDAMAYLRSVDGAQFDLVFLDPPFADDNIDEVCRLIDEYGLLHGGANVYLEQGRERPQPQLPAGWRVLKDKTTGNVRYMLVAPPD